MDQPKFAIGDQVSIAFTPPTPDPAVPDQVNGKFPGNGVYPTKAEHGAVKKIVFEATGLRYEIGDIGRHKRSKLAAESELSPYTPPIDGTEDEGDNAE